MLIANRNVSRLPLHVAGQASRRTYCGMYIKHLSMPGCPMYLSRLGQTHRRRNKQVWILAAVLPTVV